ncbi:MAG: adenosylcobinamide-phosphate synthase CbiB [Paracoccus sp. (in: a-proteobacteria)]|nr:adenosylcobinamide-phosphate synthase CbiB [Paracoccus sp. (in: a-proteobacteria)]
MSFALIALAAAIIERIFGWPDWLWQRIGHPVSWIGRVIEAAERRFNHGTPRARRRAGLLLVLGLLAGALFVGLTLEALPAVAGAGLGLALAASLPASRSLHAHVADVASALERGGAAEGRIAVSRIVGRDPAALDEPAIARAAIESLAENFSDGVVAPLLWIAALGPAGGVGYKAINTADSMIGHRSARYEDFGRASARLDDLLNWPAARISGGLIVLAAAITPGMSRTGARRAMARDARAHRSPNAGWPEAAMAGALDISIAGPRAYGGVMSTDREMNAGARREVSAGDIRRALRLYRVADGLLLAGLAALALLIWGLG